MPARQYRSREDIGDVRARLECDLTPAEFAEVRAACGSLHTTISQFIAKLVIPHARKVNKRFPPRKTRPDGRTMQRRPRGKEQLQRVVSYMSSKDALIIDHAWANLRISESEYIASVIVPAAQKINSR